jgi:hypothetical protein
MAIATTSFSGGVIVVDLTVVRAHKAGHHLSGPWSDDLHHDDDASLVSHVVVSVPPVVSGISVPVVSNDDNKKRGGGGRKGQKQLARIRNAHATASATIATASGGGGAINPRQEKRDAKLRDRAKAAQRDNKASKMSVVFSRQQQKQQKKKQ